MRSQVQAGLGPGVEVILGGNRTTSRAGGSAVRDVLGKGGGTDDGGLVNLRVLPDVVHGSVALHRADLGSLGRSLAVRRVLLDVVLDERVLGPPIHRDQDSAGRVRGRSVKGDVPKARRVRRELLRGRWAIIIVTYLVVPLLQPLPTTKSPAPEKLTEYPLLVGEKLTLPPVL